LIGTIFISLLACAGDHAPAAASTTATATAPTAQPALSGPAGDPTVGATGPVGPTITLSVGDTTWPVEIADDRAEREHGLMYRDGLAEDHGMVFVYPDQRLRAFWMKNTRIPLSIAFLDGQGRVVSISDMAPFDLSTTPSGRPAMYAVEMSAGWFAAHGVAVGAKVEGLPPPSRE